MRADARAKMGVVESAIRRCLKMRAVHGVELLYRRSTNEPLDLGSGHFMYSVESDQSNQISRILLYYRMVCIVYSTAVLLPWTAKLSPPRVSNNKSIYFEFAQVWSLIDLSIWPTAARLGSDRSIYSGHTNMGEEVLDARTMQVSKCAHHAGQ